MEKILKKLGIAERNEMQLEAEKSISENKNTLLLSPTGSGKTLAFLIPLLDIINKDLPQIQVLILAPSRELAMQIESVWREMGTGIKINSFYGGHTVEVEMNNLKNPPLVLVGTPGRIADHFTRNSIQSKNIKTIVYDEFDKSLEMGFHEQIQYILDNLPKPSKQVFVSATQGISIPEFVDSEHLNVLDFIDEKSGNQKLSLRFVKTKNKSEALITLLGQISQEPTLIFCNQRDEAEELAGLLYKKQINCVIFHGKIEQVEREKALIKFRNGSVRYLISTDLAARGLDIPEIENVIHYSLPFHAQEFIHRNGRTARMNASGTAYFFDNSEERLPDYVGDLATELILEEKQKLPAKEIWSTVYFSGGKKDKINKIDIVGFCLQKGGINKEDLGRIEVQDFVSYVAVKSSKLVSFLKTIKDQKIKGKKMKIELAR
ncbi:MAG: DEAD/DEAH box helicase [Cytophagaceae bacterium]|nr:DEAD/DEAH box helicase [Cytophagaceae bacterium]